MPPSSFSRFGASLLLAATVVLLVGVAGTPRAAGQDGCRDAFPCRTTTTDSSSSTSGPSTTTSTTDPTSTTSPTTTFPDDHHHRSDPPTTWTRDRPPPTAPPTTSAPAPGPSTASLHATPAPSTSSSAPTATTLPILVPTTVAGDPSAASSLAAARLGSADVPPAGPASIPWNWIVATVIGIVIGSVLIVLDRRGWSRR